MNIAPAKLFYSKRVDGVDRFVGCSLPKESSPVLAFHTKHSELIAGFVRAASYRLLNFLGRFLKDLGILARDERVAEVLSVCILHGQERA